VVERRPFWAWALAGLIVVFLFWPTPPWARLDAVSLSFVAAVLTVLLSGWLLLARPGQRGNGALMLLMDAVATASEALTQLQTGPGQVIGYLLYPCFGVPFAVLVLRWPRRRLTTPTARWLVGYAAVSIPLLRMLDIVTWDPAWVGYTGSAWWPVLFPDRTVNDWIYRVERANLVALAAALLVLMTLRVHRATQAERRALIPVVVAGAAFAGFAATDAASEVLEVATPISLVLSNVSLMAIPVAVLVSLILRRVQRALAVEALLQPQRLPDPESVRTAIARALGDRGLTLELWAPERQRYLTPDGQEVAASDTSRHPVDLTSADGQPVARLGVDPRLADEADLVESVARAAGLALDNARLQAELRARQRDAEDSVLRLDEARSVERSLSRLVPGGLAERLRTDPDALTRTERLTVTVLMSDIRGYSAIAERTEPTELAAQLNEHRRAMNEVVLRQGGTVMQYVGDAVLAVFGAPDPRPDHAARAVHAALGMHEAQQRLDDAWIARGLEPFGLGIGVCTGEVAAAFLGSEERLEYTVVGDTVNLAARLCDLARPAGSTVASAATVTAAPGPWASEALPALRVKGRVASVSAFRVTAGEPAADVG
jgi:class 3 adenylate cyclase